ncbi:lysylphosphatidylglycerol synthase transmembrane domain-containing protein [Desulfobacter curvatus]|uniref:lysylphosphatidylglycerol synthase transmembrane domain-containing protein n=1 Tax=Desulfobacter curvatus TaxID=2290 RepID=UPI00037CC06F|nr:lysylphosphatidylglycerol synthase transmembrane domain-containing protein [Desulfobacter curvatus]
MQANLFNKKGKFKKISIAWIWPFILSGFVIYAFLRHDFSEMPKAFHRIDWPLISLSFVFNIFILYFRVYKWAILFKPMNRRFSYFNMCLSLFVGGLFNMVIPARAGGLVQAFLLGKKENESFSTALGTVTLVRIFDSIMLIFLGLLILLIRNIPRTGAEYFQSISQTAGTAGVFLTLLVIILFGFTKSPKAMDRLVLFLLLPIPGRFKPGTQKAAIQFRQGLICLNFTGYVCLGLLLSLVFWLLCGVNVCILLKALGLEFTGILPSLLILLAQAFSMGIPAPANVGPYHAATVTVLSFYGVPVQSALYAAIVMHGAMFISNTLPGLFYLWLDKTPILTLLKGIKNAGQNVR